MMGRLLQTRLPRLARQLTPQTPNHEEIRQADEEAKLLYKKYYDRRHGVRDLAPLCPGQPVLIKLDTEKRWEKSGVVKAADKENRTYAIQTPTGDVRRNRNHLQPIPSLPYKVTEVPDDDLEDHLEDSPGEQSTVPRVPTETAGRPIVQSRTSTRVRKKPTRFIEEY